MELDDETLAGGNAAASFEEGTVVAATVREMISTSNAQPAANPACARFASQIQRPLPAIKAPSASTKVRIARISKKPAKPRPKPKADTKTIPPSTKPRRRRFFRNRLQSRLRLRTPFARINTVHYSPEQPSRYPIITNSARVFCFDACE